MKVILVEAVKSLGAVGQVVDVKPGYAKHLIRDKVALEATANNLNEVKTRQKALAAKAAQALADAKEEAKLLSGKSVVVKLKCGDAGRLYGSITSQHIADAIKEMGLEVDKRNIKVDEAVKAVGEYKAEVKIHPEVSVPFVLSVKALED